MECIFCEIVSGKIATDIVYQDEDFIAFRDIHPQAPKHLVIIPKAHIPSLNQLKTEHRNLMGGLILLARELANQEGIGTGYRLSISCGAEGGQVVPHLHLHLIGGRKLSDWLG